MTDDQIIDVLQIAVQAAVDASTLPALPIAGVAVDFEVPNDQKYLEFIFLPNNETGAFWGDEEIKQGAFRLVLHWPKDGAGAIAPMAVRQSIASYFTKDMWLSGIQIAEVPDHAAPLVQPAEILYPVTVRYSHFQG